MNNRKLKQKGTTAMLVSEIFDSIDGEGVRAGMLCTFIRLFGCNLRCSYCDSMYAVDKKYTDEPPKEMTVTEVLAKANRRYRRVTLTGGEPLLFSESVKLVNRLCDNDFEVNIETNGSCDIVGFRSLIYNKSNMFFTIDFKLPSSGMMNEMMLSNFTNLRRDDVLKFVIGTEEDCEVAIAYAKKLTEYYGDECPYIYVGTVFGEYDMSDAIERFMREPELKDVRFQLQLHKFIWDPDARGV